MNNKSVNVEAVAGETIATGEQVRVSIDLEVEAGEAIAVGEQVSVSISDAVAIVRTWSPEEQAACKARAEAAPDAAAVEKVVQDKPDLWQILRTVPPKHLSPCSRVLSVLSLIESSIQLARRSLRTSGSHRSAERHDQHQRQQPRRHRLLSGACSAAPRSRALVESRLSHPPAPLRPAGRARRAGRADGPRSRARGARTCGRSSSRWRPSAAPAGRSTRPPRALRSRTCGVGDTARAAGCPRRRAPGYHSRVRQLSRLMCPPVGAGNSSGVSSRGGIASSASSARAVSGTRRRPVFGYGVSVPSL